MTNTNICNTPFLEGKGCNEVRKHMCSSPVLDGARISHLFNFCVHFFLCCFVYLGVAALYVFLGSVACT
jgi:hypothetical protein